MIFSVLKGKGETMRLIDVDKLISYRFKNDISYNAFINLIERQSIIVASPIVRCKDCAIQQNCRFAQGLGLNGFCSQGEWSD